MSPDIALNPELQKLYPFSRLTGPANVLVMPGLQTANISAKLLRELGGDAVIGPMLVGMKQQVQIAAMTRDRLGPGDPGGARRGPDRPLGLSRRRDQLRIVGGRRALAALADRADIAEQFLEQAAVAARGSASRRSIGSMLATSSMPVRLDRARHCRPRRSGRGARSASRGRGMLKASWRVSRET